MYRPCIDFVYVSLVRCEDVKSIMYVCVYVCIHIGIFFEEES